jgi:hypothetical protein
LVRIWRVRAVVSTVSDPIIIGVVVTAIADTISIIVALVVSPFAGACQSELQAMRRSA